MVTVCRTLTFAILCALGLSACGGGSLTLSEYSTEVAAVIEALDSRLDAHAQEYFAGPQTVAEAREYVRVRVEGYLEAVDGIATLDPPEEVADLHAVLEGIMAELLAAEAARAEFAGGVSSDDELELVWEGPQAQAIRGAEQEAIVLCRAAQSQFDATEQREELAYVPWMPPELKEVVRVALDCP